DRILEAGRNRLAVAENEAARALAQLPLWTGPLETLETACVHTVETIDRFEAGFARIGTEHEQLRTERRSTVAEQAEADGALEHLRQIAGTVPTEGDLVQARALRDQLWRLIRRAWESNSLPTSDDIGSLLKPRQRLEFLEIQEKELLQRAEETHSRWATAWASLGLDSLSPREMHGWLQLQGS